MNQTEIDADFALFRSSGDPEALARVFDASAQKLLLLAVHLTGEHGLAEDVLQNTFLIAVEQAQSFDSKRPVLPWLSGILVHEARKELRRRRRRLDPERMSERSQPGPDEEVEASELGAQLTRAIESMPATYRQVLNLHLLHGLKAIEIAHALGMPPETVRTQLHRGLPMLRRLLPAGLAGSVLLLSSGRGLAAMRELVVKRGEESWAASPSTIAAVASASKGLASKKLFVGLLILLCLPLAYLSNGSMSSLSTAGMSTEGEFLELDLNSSTLASSKVAEREVLVDERESGDSWLLRGRVLDQEAAPLAAAVVRAQINRGELVTELPSVVSAPDGTYSVDLAPLRQFSILQRAIASLEVTATYPSYEQRESGFLRELPWLAEGSRTLEIDVELRPSSPPPAVVRGRVLLPDHSPAAGARVRIWQGLAPDQEEWLGENGQRSLQYCDENGCFDFPLLMAGTVALRASDDAYGTCLLRSEYFDGEKDQSLADMVLETHRILEGRMLLADGGPLPLQWISVARVDIDEVSTEVRGGSDQLRQEFSHRPLRTRSTRTDVDGHFRVAGLEPGEYEISLRVSKGGTQSFRVKTWDPPSEHLVRAQLLTVKLRDMEDRPLPGLSITYQGWRGEAAPTWEDWYAAKQAAEAVADTGSRGMAVVNEVVASRDFLLAEESSWVFTSHLRGTLPIAEYWRVEPEVARAELTLRFQIPKNLGRLEFDIRDELDRRVPKYQVSVKSSLGTFVGSYTNEDSAPDLPDGTYRLTVKSGKQLRWVWPNFPVESEVQVVAGQTQRVLLRARRGGFVQLHLRLPEDSDVEAWEELSVKSTHPRQKIGRVSFATILVKDGTVIHMRSPPVGKTLLCTQAFEPGNHDLVIHAQGFQEIVVPVQVVAGEVSDLEVFMRHQ